MLHVNYLAIVSATVAVFVFSAIYYVVLSGPRADLSGAPTATSQAGFPAWMMVLELGRAFAVAAMVAVLVSLSGITDVPRALALTLGLWVAFPVVLLVGSIVHESVPVGLAAIHAGDWLVKLLLIGLIVTIWK